MGILGGCAQPDPTGAPNSGGDAGYAEVARDADASAEQIAALDDGDVTYDEYETAMNRAFDCMRASGLSVTIAGTKSQHGTTVLDYTVAGTTAATDLSGEPGRELENGCYLREARFVDMFWQTATDEAVAWSGRRTEALGPALRDCLQKAGAEAPADASFEDLINAASDLTQQNPSSDCMGDIDYGSWDG